MEYACVATSLLFCFWASSINAASLYPHPSMA
jgi:hypothetical protein